MDKNICWTYIKWNIRSIDKKLYDNKLSAIHECTLQSESFTLGPKLKKPTAKLGAVIDKVKEYRNQNYGIYDAIVQASKDCNYYVNQINAKLSKIIKDGFEYYWKSKQYNDSYILLSDGDWEVCNACVENLKKNTDIQKVLHPTDMFDNFLPSFNEDALFLDVIVTYNGHCTTLKLKMKADNWTIDEENKTLVLNDVKTTSKPCAWFMNSEYGSFYHYHYYRQFALYMMMLQTYCIKEYGFNHNWTSKGHVLVVNTSEYDTRLCYVSKEQFAKGKEEYEQLLKRIGYYTINGFEEEVEFV